MYYPGLARLSWRTGATFVHDWFALAVGVLVLGHIAFAINDREARRGMRTGRVSASWAHAEHAAWAADAEADVDADVDVGPDRGERRT
jgi:formate dehydrogenase subunit gamma